MPGSKSELKSLRATKYTSSLRSVKGWERLRRSGYHTGLQVMDLWDRARGREHPLLPPRRYRRFIGNGDFLKVGREITAYMRDELGMGPGHDVLDAGCGAGRIAVPLTDMLTEGSYLASTSCRTRSTGAPAPSPRATPTSASRTSTSTRRSTTRSTLSSADFRFPADDAAFDLAALIGLISHLRPAEMENYLAESARVLRPGGQCFATAYLVDDAVAANIARGATAFEFTHDHGDYYVHSEEEPTYAIAYRLDHILSVAARHGLRMRRDPRPGTWGVSARRPASMDLLVLERA